MPFTTRNVIFAIMLICPIVLMGCQEQNATSYQQARLIVDENLQLKATIDQLHTQIESIKAENEISLAAKQAEIDKCLAENDRLTEQLGGLFEEKFIDIIRSFTEDNIALQAENEALKAQLSQTQPDPNS